MKIQLIFLIVCVVASFALPEGNRSANSELSGRGEQRQEHETTREESASADDELIDSEEENVDERTISSNETAAEGRKCNNREWRRHNRRYWLRRDKESRGTNSNGELNNGEGRRPVTTGCQESQNSLSQNERTGNEGGSHHRHSHRRDQHHHKNRANTTAQPLTSTISSNAPLAEPYQEIQIPTAN